MGEKRKKSFISDNALLLSEWDWGKNTLSPDEVSTGSAKICSWKCSICGFSWEAAAYSRGSNGCGCPECAKKKRASSKRKSSAKKNSFVLCFPEIAKEWHTSKNAEYDIEDISSFSNVKAWWKCSKCGNEWATTVNHRTKEGNGCPVCSKKQSSAKKIETHAKRNNFALMHPEFAAEWHPYRNNDLQPSNISVFSNRRVWWICSFCGYEWQTTVNHRSQGEGCPNCSKAQTSFAEQALFFYISKVFPDALHRYKLTYEFDVYIPSKKIALEYDGYFYHRGEDKLENDNKKDRFCNENKITLFRFRSPRLPNTESAIIISCADRKLQSAILEFFNILNCSDVPTLDIDGDTIKIQEQFRQQYINNSLAIKYPSLLHEWHPWKNGKLKPSAVSYSSSLKCWWLCRVCNYEWQDTPNHRTGRGSGCPFCASKVVIAGINDLLTTHPHIAEEWHHEKNGDLLATQVSSKSNKRVWWKCIDYGHEWQAVISERTRSGHSTNCPYCGNKKVLPGFNDLATISPELLKEWHFQKNALLPTQLTAGSHKKVWWKCKYGHEWEAAVYSRKKCGCPICAGKKAKHSSFTTTT